MYQTFFIFFILFSLIVIPNADAEILNGYLLADGEAGGNADDEIIAENNEPVDLSNNVETVPETTETVGGVEVTLSQEVEFVATDGDVVTLKNTALPTVTVEIPNRAIVSAPASWNGELTTPTTVAVTGTVDTAFVAPTTGILFGSPDVVLVFDKAVTILLTGTTGQTAYKLAGSSTWILISGCTGDYDNPNDPPVNGECSISDGTNTKILTFHFTHFSGLSSTPASTPTTTTTPSTGSSGGHGNTGVGSPRIFGGSSGGSSGGGNYYGPGETQQSVFPAWFDNVTDWYREGKIGAKEFLNAYQWIMENL